MIRLEVEVILVEVGLSEQLVLVVSREEAPDRVERRHGVTGALLAVERPCAAGIGPRVITRVEVSVIVPV
jgi:hypothetical protein